MKFSTVYMFRKNLSAKKIYPIYFLAGEESFLLEDCLKRIEKKINIDDLNREVFQATESSGRDILNSVETLPFLTDKRIVILKMANKLKNDDYKVIEQIIENHVDKTCFIILFPDKVKNSTSKRVTTVIVSIVKKCMKKMLNCLYKRNLTIGEKQ